MCTAISWQSGNHYFGRNLDYEYSYHETVTVTPRHYPFLFRKRKGKAFEEHYAMIGMAYVVNDYPLYYDATNEKGLSMAGLNFPENAVYHEEVPGKSSITPFELIPWVLGQCETIEECRVLLERTNIVNIPFSEELPLSPLHWIISDREKSITVESVEEGIFVYDNPAGVLTNNPPFPSQMFLLQHYMGLTNEEPERCFSGKLDLKPYCRGMGAVGLPGDLSSASRFVRAVFHKLHGVSGETESEAVSEFFHLLSSVESPRGAVVSPRGVYEITIYSSCCNVDQGIYYYTTYENQQITAVDMYHEDIESDRLVNYPLIEGQQFRRQN